jgi:hypothetical protein
MKAIRERVNILADHAYAGRPAAHMEPPFREWPISSGAGSDIVLYDVQDLRGVPLRGPPAGRAAGLLETV